MVDVGARRLDRAASWTAEVNAFQRAAETLRPPGRRLVEDTYSRHFVRNPALRAMLTHPRAADAALRVFDHLWGGLHAHIALRVRYVDDACAAAIGAGISQLVLLGAGCDTTAPPRGHPGDDLRGRRAGHSGREASGRRAAAAGAARLPNTLDRLRFGTQRSARRTARRRLRPLRGGARGVAGSYSLPDPRRHRRDTRRPRRAVRPGSRLVLDHIAAGVVAASTPWKSAGRITRMVARRGEPYRSDFTEADLTATLTEYGFELRDHATVSALLRRYDPTRASRLADDDWLAVATAERGCGAP